MSTGSSSASRQSWWISSKFSRSTFNFSRQETTSPEGERHTGSGTGFELISESDQSVKVHRRALARNQASFSSPSNPVSALAVLSTSPISRTAGPEPSRRASCGSSASVPRSVRRSGSDAHSTSATGVTGQVAAAALAHGKHACARRDRERLRMDQGIVKHDLGPRQDLGRAQREQVRSSGPPPMR